MDIKLIIQPFALGFLVALCTTLLLGREKSRRFPGGSIAVGIFTWHSLSSDGQAILGGALGFLGWLTFQTIHSWMVKKEKRKRKTLEKPKHKPFSWQNEGEEYVLGSDGELVKKE